MRRINLLFISIPLLLLVLLVVTKNLNRSTSNFFGVAENQETQINLEHACSIDSIYVTEGQFVSKGALLLEVTRSALDFKMSELTHDISELLARDRLNIDDIKGDLNEYAPSVRRRWVLYRQGSKYSSQSKPSTSPYSLIFKVCLLLCHQP